MKKYGIYYRRFDRGATDSYDYAVQNNFDGTAIKGQFSTEWDAILWAINDGNISILDLDTEPKY